MLLVPLHPAALRTCAALALLAAVVQETSAQQAGSQPYVIAGSQVRRFASRAVGDTFEVTVATPPSYGQSAERYPVVITLDADLAFGAVAQIARLMQYGHEVPEFVLVGIGYGDFNTALVKRYRDFTPTVDSARTACASEGACGGATRFLEFIESELLPSLAARYRVDRADMTLIGNSLGALFGSYVLLRKPTLFRRYVLGSPGLGWDRNWAVRALRDWAPAADLDARVFIGVGGAEGTSVSADSEFVSELRRKSGPGLSATFHVFEGEQHDSAQPMVVSRGLRVLFATSPPGGSRPQRR